MMDRERLLNAMRIVCSDLRLFRAEIEEIGIYLSRGDITPDGAILLLHDVGAAEYVSAAIERAIDEMTSELRRVAA